MRIIVCCALLATACVSWAANPYGYVFAVTPNPVPPGASIGVTIQTTEPQCVALPPTLNPLMDGEVVTLVVPTSDGCENVPPESRMYDIGALPAGTYTFRFVACGGNPPPGSPSNGCFTIEDMLVSVRGLSSARSTIPALSDATLVGLALLTAASGAMLLRRLI